MSTALSRTTVDLVAFPDRPAMVVESRKMIELLTIADRSARGDAKILITGESGVGKDLVASHIHAASSRKGQPFVVGEMSLRMQALLLRFFENGEIRPVGSDRGQAAKVDVRVIAATNRNLSEMVAAGQFREDLLYRLRVIHLHVPPLRERPQDIRRLVQHFVERSRQHVTFTEQALQALEHHRWPGNVRELLNIVEQALWLAPAGLVDVGHLPSSIRAAEEALQPMPERRRQVPDDLYDALTKGGYSFWQHVYPLFQERDITRHDVRELVRRGLHATKGNYRLLLKHFGMPERDYKRFMNFLAAHNCQVDFREFRGAGDEALSTPPFGLPPLSPEDYRMRAAVDSETGASSSPGMA
jgi:DNA-binding NtrC family response regulator